MATSWTKIESLMFILPIKCRSQKQSTIALLDLLPFAEHCPELGGLSLFIDATDPQELDDYKPLNGISQTELTELSVGDSLAENPALIATFLTSCFESLESIKTADSEDAENTDTKPEEGDELQENEKVWRRVEELLPVLSAVRLQERLRLLSK